VAPPLLNWPAKDPGDVLDYQIDIAPALIGNEGDVISTLDVTITPGEPGDLTLAQLAADGSSVVMWLSGGQASTVYTVTVHLTTVNGRAVQRSILLPVLCLSATASPSNAIYVATGVILTDQNGNPMVV
jgi:hypothetical protein